MLNPSHIDVFPLIYLQNEPSDIKTHYQIEKLVFSRDRLGLNGPLNNSMLYNIGNHSDFKRKNGFDLDRVQIVLNYPIDHHSDFERNNCFDLDLVCIVLNYPIFCRFYPIRGDRN